MSAAEKRTKEAADWIYACDITAQLGAQAACVVARHVEQLCSAEEFEEMPRWQSTFSKVVAPLRGQTAPVRH